MLPPPCSQNTAQFVQVLRRVHPGELLHGRLARIEPRHVVSEIQCSHARHDRRGAVPAARGAAGHRRARRGRPGREGRAWSWRLHVRAALRMALGVATAPVSRRKSGNRPDGGALPARSVSHPTAERPIAPTLRADDDAHGGMGGRRARPDRQRTPGSGREGTFPSRGPGQVRVARAGLRGLPHRPPSGRGRPSTTARRVTPGHEVVGVVDKAGLAASRAGR